MAERKEITKLSVITDSETSYDNIGDIDGGMFNEVWLKKHIKSHGTGGLLEKLAHMNRQIMNTQVEIYQEEESDAKNCKAS